MTEDKGRIEAAWMSVDLLYDESGSAFTQLLADAPSLAWLQSSFAGADHPVYRPLLERGVRVCVSHENALSIAEFVLGAVLRTYQRPELWSDAQARRA